MPTGGEIVAAWTAQLATTYKGDRTVISLRFHGTQKILKALADVGVLVLLREDFARMNSRLPGFAPVTEFKPTDFDRLVKPEVIEGPPPKIHVLIFDNGVPQEKIDGYLANVVSGGLIVAPLGYRSGILGHPVCYDSRFVVFRRA